MNPTQQLARYLNSLLAVSALMALSGCLIIDNEQVLGTPVAVEANLADDALVAPAVPELSITYNFKALSFFWENTPDVSRTSLYAYNKITDVEVIVDDQIDVSTNSYLIPVQEALTPVSDWEYRIELCSADNCLSSYRVPVKPVIEVRRSQSGDTVAVAHYQPDTQQIDVSVFDRLNNAWYETSQWQSTYVKGEGDTPSLITMTDDATTLEVLGENGLNRYKRVGLNYYSH